MNIGAIIQARLSSTRLPRKILMRLPLNGEKTVLEHVIERIKQSSMINTIIIATTTEEDDNDILNVVEKTNVKCFRGDLNDVLSRYFHAAQEFDLDLIVRITSDCPCIDPDIIDEAIRLHINRNADYTSNIQNRTYPHGLDVEVFSIEALSKVFNHATLQSDREHVCPYFYNHPEMFKLTSLTTESPNLYGPEIRITLDTKQDYILLCALFDYMYTVNPKFRTNDIINLFSEHPWLKMLNDSIVQKKISYNYDEEVNEALKIIGLQGLNQVKKKLLEFREKGEL